MTPLHRALLEDREHHYEVQIAVIAARVEVAETGNLSVLGIFNSIGATGFPTQIPDLTVLVRVQYGLSSASTTPKLTIFKFADGDGSLHEFRLEAMFPPPPAGVWAVSDNSITLKHFPIEAPGEYAFEFWLEGHQLCSLPLNVILVNPDQILPGGTPQSPAP